MKMKKKWKISCGMCETEMLMDAIEIIDDSQKDKKADFIIQPSCFCAECKSVCMLELVEVEVKPPIPS